jgi:hypothetical protein
MIGVPSISPASGIIALDTYVISGHQWSLFDLAKIDILGEYDGFPM